MVLESLFPDKTIENKPLDMFLVSIILTAAAIAASYFVFPRYAGIIMPLLVAVGMAPLMCRMFQEEEEEMDEVAESKLRMGFFQRHGVTFKMFTLLFLGGFVTVFLVSVLAPADFVDTVFDPQISDIRSVQSMASGAAVQPGLFDVILLNNLKVMAFSFLLSFLFGAGAVFILSWNASILGIYLANFAREGLYNQLLLTTGGMLPHAASEIAGYFLAGIAGGILSVGMVREKWGTPEFRLLFRDSVLLMSLGVLAVLLGAFMESGI